MRKKIEDYKKRALQNLVRIKGGGDVPIDTDKVKRPIKRKK